jgi:hypothetical protein
VRQVGHLQELYRDAARSTEHKKLNTSTSVLHVTYQEVCKLTVTISYIILRLFKVEYNNALSTADTRVYPHAWLNDNRVNSVYYKQAPMSEGIIKKPKISSSELMKDSGKR